MLSGICPTIALLGPQLNCHTIIGIRRKDCSPPQSPKRGLGIFLAIFLTVGFLAHAVPGALAQSGEPEAGMIAPRGLHPRLQKEGKRANPRSGATVLAAPTGIQSPKSPATDNLGIVKGFEGISFTNSFDSVPPDTHLATGPQHIVEVTNATIAFFNRATGKRVFLEDLFAFFAPTGAVHFGFDPVVTYDEIAQRFVVVMVDEDEDAVKSFLLYAVSNSSNPLDGFSEMHRIDVTENGNTLSETIFADFPKIGWNADVQVITFNGFGSVSEQFDHVSVIVIDKSTVLDGNNGTFSFSHIDRGPDDFTLMPTLMHGAESGDPMWFVIESASALGSEVRLVKLSNTLGGQSFSESSITVDPYDFPPNAEQPGSGALGRIQTNDSSFISAAWRGDRLVATHTVGIDSTSQSHVRWYEFDTSGGSPSLVQQGTINPGVGVYTYYPSIDIARNGDIGMTFMQSSGAEFMSMYVTARNSAGAAGQMRTPVLVRPGQRTYRAFDCAVNSVFVDDCRAGDYSGVSIDPNFSNVFCAANEYASAKKSNNWGTWISCFAIGVHDLAVTAITAPSIVRGTGVINAAVTVTIQNRSDHTESFTLANLGNGITTGLVKLSVSRIDDDGENCLASPTVALDAGKNAALFGSGGSKALSPKQTAKIAYLVTVQCTGAFRSTSTDATKGDYSFSASVHHEVIDGAADIHEEDDVCPRDALPGGVDLLPPTKGVADKGCGGKKPDHTLGAPVVIDVIP